MCDCATVCLCLLGISAAISYFTVGECIHYSRLEAMDNEIYKTIE
jgi:hypothetical protein